MFKFTGEVFTLDGKELFKLRDSVRKKITYINWL